MISFAEGVDFEQPFVAKDSALNIIDLSSATSLTLQVWRRPREGAAVRLTVLESSSPTVLTITSATAGQFKCYFANTIQTTGALEAALTAGEYTFEVTCVLSNGNTTLIGRGEIYVTDTFNT